MRNTLIWFKEYLNVWVWGSIKGAVQNFWNACFGPCCNNPKLSWTEGPGFTVSICSNCKRSKTYPRLGF
jgi:hypothetical protein